MEKKFTKSKMTDSFWSNGDKNVHLYAPVDKVEFALQGIRHTVNTTNVDPETTLNDYLRHVMFLTGTKKMCNEGGCGSCVVAVKRPGDDKVVSVNSCLVSVLSCANWKIDTIEGIGGPTTEYHPIQKALADFNGTQCGFCSSGMIMNMYALSKNGKPTMKEVENSFSGNLCRCTGYRPILTAFKFLCTDPSTKLLGTFPDIEDFVMVKSKAEYEEEEELGRDLKAMTFRVEQSIWIKVYFLKDLLSRLKGVGNEEYMLVAGNTAKGLPYQFPSATIYFDVNNVKELTGIELRNDTLKVGANTTLTNTIALFNNIASTDSRFAHLSKMADHLDLVANVPVRNIGTIAGNLMIKYLHPEFPSDVFLLLETFLALLVIVNTSGKETQMSPQEFLAYNMRKKVIKSIVLPGLSSAYKYQTYKIMPRAQNAHALVNEGVLFKLDQFNKVLNARIIIGNINPSFIHAEKTEQFLTGKELFKNDTFQGAFKTLTDELKPNVDPPEPDPEFRKQLAFALLYKALLSMSPEEKVSPKHKSGRSTLLRPVSGGIQDYETNASLYPLTQPIPKLEALAQTSGQAQYIEDIPDLPHQLYGKFIFTKAAPHSSILKIDPSKALALKGVVQFFTNKDIPGDNNFFPSELGPGIVEKIFCDGTVEYYHQPAGLIVASDKQILKNAAELVEITYAPPQKAPLLTIRDVLKANETNYLTKQGEMKPTKVGHDIKHKIVGKFDISGQYHFHMETQCCLVVPTENGMDLYPSTQWMDHVQIAVGKMLKIPHNKINVTVRRCGGGFGAKISRNSQITCAAALAAWILKKPVRMSLTLSENMELAGKRFPFSADYEAHVNDAGVIQRFTSKVYGDHGIGGNESRVREVIFNVLKNNYCPDAFDIEYYQTKTDTPANTWMRAPGTCEVLGLLESVMDHIAYELDMDPIDVRLNNIAPTKKTRDYLGDLKEWANIDVRKQAITNFNKENRWKKKGISVVPMVWTLHLVTPFVATVSIYHVDGSVTISHGGIEIGQGINTKAAQVCAYTLNIPLEKVNVYPSNSMVSANSAFTGASITSEAICYSVERACNELLLRLKPYKKDDTSQTWEDLVHAGFANSVLLTTNSQYTANSPSVAVYYVYGSCASEVELDVLTGQYQVTRVDLIEDAGTSLSPLVDIGQVEGAFVMGMGYYTSEKLIFGKNGKQLTNSTWYFKPPGAKDIPIDFRIKLPKNNPNPAGVLQTKAIGEPPLCMAVSVPLAIRNAVASARSDSDKSKPRYFFFDGPTTVEYTFTNSLNDFKQYTL